MRALPFVLLLVAAGCDVGAIPTGGGNMPDASGGGGGDSGGGGPDASGGGGASLAIVATTSPTAGAVYNPNHVVAVWIEGPGGAFVKTIDRHANVRKQYLLGWVAKAGAADADAVSGATLTAHTPPLNIAWDLKNKAGTVVPDGTYTVRMESADQNATAVGQNNEGTFTFVKGTAPQTQSNLSNGGFSSVTLTFTP